MSREWFNPYAINTPLIGLCQLSIFFNSATKGRVIMSNVYCNLLLTMLLGVSNGCYGNLEEPLWGARLGMLGSLCFTVGAPARLIFTNRFFPRYVHYGIGSFYCTYHSLQWYKEMHGFEDAGEDAEDERF